MNDYPLIYVAPYTGHVVRFKKVGKEVFESQDGTVMKRNKLNYHYEFVRNEREKQTWITTVNGFRVRLKVKK